MITDDEILRSVTTNQQEQPDENDDNNEEAEEAAPEVPLRFQVEPAINVIRNAALYSSKLLKFFKETVKTVKTLCNVSVNF